MQHRGADVIDLVRIQLKAWDKQVDGDRDRQIQLSTRHSTFVADLIVSSNVGCSGWYAVYPEGVFVVFLDESDRVIVGWNGHAETLNSDTSVEWDLSGRGRHFRIVSVSKNLEIIDARYQTFWRYLKNPLLFFFDLFVPDDDWGLMADLPSFVHSSWKRGDLVARLHELKQG